MSDTAFEGVVREIRQEFREIRQELEALSKRVDTIKARRPFWKMLLGL